MKKGITWFSMVLTSLWILALGSLVIAWGNDRWLDVGVAGCLLLILMPFPENLRYLQARPFDSSVRAPSGVVLSQLSGGAILLTSLVVSFLF